MKVRMRIITTLGAGGLIAGLAAGPALASTHPVQAGDTLSGIAAQSGQSLSQVEAANPQIVDPNLITVGELVNVPDGQSGSSAITPASTSAPATSAPATSAPASAGTSTSTGATSSYQQCVAWRESSNTPTDPDGLYGILPSTWASLGYSGTAGQASVAQQNEAFQRLYAQDGTQPWSPYDGC
jgi:murein DD-endopeptidase MepM/ murein hydrolase activator NlpD